MEMITKMGRGGKGRGGGREWRGRGGGRERLGDK